MAKRKALAKKEDLYGFSETGVETFPSGCTVLDCVLGGGWPVGRMANIVGDKSTGKTLLAIEACANFARKFPNGKIWYLESEAAFDVSYAEKVGLPVDRVEFVEGFTVEDWYEDLVDKLKDESEQALYVVDSLDALSDRAKLGRDIDKGTYGTKAKMVNEIFRRLVQPIQNGNITLLIISQIRDKMDAAAFGKKHTRSGGRGMDFYASQVVWLAHKKRLNVTRNKVKRDIGVVINAKCEKNKVGKPFRDCEFKIYFDFGLDDLQASLEWLEAAGELSKDEVKDAKAVMDELPDNEYFKVVDQWGARVRQAWNGIEEHFARPTRVRK